MKTLIEFNIAIFAASTAILFFVLKYRVHFQVDYRHSGKRHKIRRPVEPLTPSQAPTSPITAQMMADLESALGNLGASKPEAKSRASQAMAQGPASFDTLIFRAMQANTADSGKRNPRRAG